MTRPKLPVEKLAVRWVERLNDDHEVERVLKVGDQAVYRVVPHNAASWIAQFRGEHFWSTLRGAPRKGAWGGAERVWRSPEAAMAAVEAMFNERNALTTLPISEGK